MPTSVPTKEQGVHVAWIRRNIALWPPLPPRKYAASEIKQFYLISKAEGEISQLPLKTYPRMGTDDTIILWAALLCFLFMHEFSILL